MKTFSKKPDENEVSASISCPVCGGNRFKTCWEADTASWVKCHSCSLLLQNPQPVSKDILERYDEEYFQYERENEEAFLNLMYLGLRDIGFESLSSASREPGTFLDIGCATGRLAASLRAEGWQAEGVEVCRAAAEYGSRNFGVPIFPGTLDEAEFDSNSFDIVHNSHVIEHVNTPDLFMAEIYRILKPGGYYICATPNSRSLQAVLFQERWRSAIADHLFLFSLRTLPRLAENNGFSVIRKKTWGGLGRGTAPSWLKDIADPLVKVLGWGDVMIYLFQKPPAGGSPVQNSVSLKGRF